MDRDRRLTRGTSGIEKIVSAVNREGGIFPMRRNQLVLLLLFAAMLTVFACKSVETTSAMLHNEHGNYPEAINQAKAALAKNPEDAEAHYQLAYSYSMTNNRGASRSGKQEGRCRDQHPEQLGKAFQQRPRGISVGELRRSGNRVRAGYAGRSASDKGLAEPRQGLLQDRGGGFDLLGKGLCRCRYVAGKDQHGRRGVR